MIVVSAGLNESFTLFILPAGSILASLINFAHTFELMILVQHYHSLLSTVTLTQHGRHYGQQCCHSTIVLPIAIGTNHIRLNVEIKQFLPENSGCFCNRSSHRKFFIKTGKFIFAERGET